MRQIFKKMIFKLLNYRGWVGFVSSKGWQPKWLTIVFLGQIQPHQRNFKCYENYTMYQCIQKLFLKSVSEKSDSLLQVEEGAEVDPAVITLPE